MTWTTERREKMSALMKELKPWEKSTGPITDEGKKRSSLNGSVSKLKKVAAATTEESKPVELLAIPAPIETKEQRELREYLAFRRSIG